MINLHDQISLGLAETFFSIVDDLSLMTTQIEINSLVCL